MATSNMWETKFSFHSTSFLMRSAAKRVGYPTSFAFRLFWITSYSAFYFFSLNLCQWNLQYLNYTVAVVVVVIAVAETSTFLSPMLRRWCSPCERIFAPPRIPFVCIFQLVYQLLGTLTEEQRRSLQYFTQRITEHCMLSKLFVPSGSLFLARQ